MPRLSAVGRIVRVIGSNGQISLGKKFAGRQVLVEEQEAGVWLIRTASVLPDNERWLHEGKASKDLRAALEWSQRNAPTDASTDGLMKRLHGKS